jgi:hypothetical protein
LIYNNKTNNNPRVASFGLFSSEAENEQAHHEAVKRFKK